MHLTRKRRVDRRVGSVTAAEWPLCPSLGVRPWGGESPRGEGRSVWH